MSLWSITFIMVQPVPSHKELIIGTLLVFFLSDRIDRLCIGSNNQMIKPDIIFYLDREPVSDHEKKISQAYTKMNDEWIIIKSHQDIENIHSYVKIKVNEIRKQIESQS